MYTLKKIEWLCKFILDFVFDDKFSKNVRKLKIKEEFFYKKQPDDLAFTVFSYKQKEIRELIHILKYHRGNFALNTCAEFLAKEILSAAGKIDLANAILIPIPRSKKRLKQFGFNQCDLLCKEILKNSEIKKLNLNFMPKILTQNKSFETQTKLSRKNRIQNAKESFSIKFPEKISGKKIILIDDVWTTGATLLDASRALKQANAKEIVIFALAH